MTAADLAAPHGADLSDVVLREPTLDDVGDLHRLVVGSGRLDVNSQFAYLVLCRDFAGTSVVATLGGRVIGFLTGYVRPDAPDTYFSWQSAVDPTVPVPGLALAMMTTVLDRVRPRGVRFFEVTFCPDNRAVVLLIRRLARQHGTRPELVMPLEQRWLGPGHEPEALYRFPVDRVAG